MTGVAAAVGGWASAVSSEHPAIGFRFAGPPRGTCPYRWTPISPKGNV